MDVPTMFPPRRVASDVDALTAYVPLPGLGVLPVNAYLIRAAEPVLVDAGMIALGESYFDALCSLIDPQDIRWIALTHADPDHVGCLDRVLAEAPRARLITTYLGMGKLSLTRPVNPERVYLLNPGQSLFVGDRNLLALRPPSFDAPETTALFDDETGVLFSSDCFGALLREPAEDAGAVRASDLAAGLVTWTTVDSPWLASVDPAAFGRILQTVRALSSSAILSSHLPPATGMAETLLGYLERACSAPAFVGPDQQALEQMLGAA